MRDQHIHFDGDHENEPSALSVRLRTAFLSTWTIAGLCTLAVASILDQTLGDSGIGADARLASADGPSAALVYIARIGFPPVIAVIGFLAALWLLKRHRPNAAAAAATVAAVVIAFSARPLTTVDLIGWRRALLESAIAGRTVATTAVATVLAFVLYRERFVRQRWVAILAVGLPLLIGTSRVALGVHRPLEIVGQWTVGVLIALGIVWAYLVADKAASDDDASPA
ncbi:MAG TPA: phosphatase PAP2 family protein [Gemmatimonadaceae bacterium]|jgi:membrane-associated phospholipid phosphatase